MRVGRILLRAMALGSMDAARAEVMVFGPVAAIEQVGIGSGAS